MGLRAEKIYIPWGDMPRIHFISFYLFILYTELPYEVCEMKFVFLI